MNMIGTIGISMALRTVGAVQSMNTFEKGVTASLARINTKIAGLGRTFTYGLAAPMAIMGYTAVNTFADFESSLAKIEGLVGKTTQEVKYMGDEILKMSSKVGKSPQELADAMYFITSADPRRGVAESLSILESSSKAAAAGLGETKDVADFVTSAINAYGKEAITAAQATDILVAGVREGKAEATEFAKHIGAVIPVASNLEVSLNEVVAGVAAMTRTGTPASKATTYLRRTLFSLAKQVPQVSKALKEMGMSYTGVRKSIREEGLIETLVEIGEVAQRFGEDKLASIFPNLRAFIGVADILGKNLENNLQIWEALEDPIGSTNKAFETVTNTLNFKFKQALVFLQTRIMGFGEALGNAILPVFNAIINKVGEVAEWFSNLSSSTQQMIIKIGMIATVVGPALIVLSSFISIIEALIGVISLLTSRILLVPAAILIMVGVIRNVNKVLEAGNVAANRFMKNFGAYVMVAFKKAEVGAWAFLSVLGDIIDGLMNLNPAYIAGTTTGLLPKVDMSGWAQENMKEAQEQLKNFQDILPGGTESWNWVDQLMPDFKEGSKGVWEGMKDDAASAFKWIGEQFDKMTGDMFKFDTSGFGPGEMPLLKEMYIPMYAQKLIEHVRGSMQGGGYKVPGFDKLDLQGNIDYGMAQLNKLINTFQQERAKITETFSGVDFDERMLEQKLEVIGGTLNPVNEKIQFLQSALQQLEQISPKLLTDEEIEKIRTYQDELKGMQNMLLVINGAANLLASSFVSVGEALITSGANMEDFAKSMVSSIEQIIQALLVQAIAGMLAGEAVKGLPGLIFAAVGIGMIKGMFNKSKNDAASAAQMAQGGIVPSGYPNDSYPALLTSGETVMPPEKLNKLFDDNRKQYVLPEGQWRIKGKDLIYIIDEQRRRNINSY